MSVAVQDYGEHRFGIGATAGLRWRWHAVDLAVLGPRLDAAAAEGRGRRSVEVYSVCGVRSDYASRLGPFTYGSRWLTSRRCERCGWVVALSRGTIEQEIDLYTVESGVRDVIAVGGGDPGLLRRIFTAILADAPPGREAEAGHRSDLLAHAAAHRPVIAVCEVCAHSSSPTVVHGVNACPESRVACGACTFTAGPWAGEWEGTATGECVVARAVLCVDHAGRPLRVHCRRRRPPNRPDRRRWQECELRAAISARLDGGGARTIPLIVLAAVSTLGDAPGAQAGRLQLLALGRLVWRSGETAAAQGLSPGQPTESRASKHVGEVAGDGPTIPAGAGHDASKQQSTG